MVREAKGRLGLAGIVGLVIALATVPAAWAGVYLNVPTASPERPATVPDYEVNKVDPREPSKFLSVQALLTGVAWSSWGGSEAVGTGKLEVESSDTRPGQEQPFASQTIGVSISATELASCAGQQVYTRYVLTPDSGETEPQDFAYVRERSVPCRVHALRYFPGIEKEMPTTGNCVFRGVSAHLPPGLGYMAWCDMKWSGWSESDAVGVGVGRAITTPHSCDGHEECDYGIRVELSGPKWCPAWGMSYTRERLELFGSGIPLSSEPQTKTGAIAPSVADHLLTTVVRSSKKVIYSRAEC